MLPGWGNVAIWSFTIPPWPPGFPTGRFSPPSERPSQPFERDYIRMPDHKSPQRRTAFWSDEYGTMENRDAHWDAQNRRREALLARDFRFQMHR